MRFAFVVLGLLAFVSTVQAQRIHVEPEKTDSGSVIRQYSDEDYFVNANRTIGHNIPYQQIDRAFFSFALPSIEHLNQITRVWMEYGSSSVFPGDTVEVFVVPAWQRSNEMEAYESIENGISLDAVSTTTSNLHQEFDITSMEAINAIFSTSNVTFGFVLHSESHRYVIFNVKLYVEYCGGATATLTINNVIEQGIEYAGSNSLVRMGASEFLEPPIAREALLGGNITCEVWNARYDSTTTGMPMKPFLWDNKPYMLPPTYTVLNYDTSSMASEYTSYARGIIPASISTVDEFDGALSVEVFFKDPWRIRQEDSVQTREGGYLPHITPYSTPSDETTFGVFTGIFPGAYPEVYSIMVPVAVDSIGTTILSDTLHVMDRVFAGIRVTPSGAATFSGGERMGYYMKFDIIFHGESADIAVTYKHHRNSKGQALSAQNQRNICHDIFGRYHMVYSDLGEVWYTTSLDGLNWSHEKRVSSGQGLAANPSVRSAQYLYGGDHSYHPVYITFAENEGVVLASIDDDGVNHTVWTSGPLPGMSTLSLHPSVAAHYMCSHPFVLVVYETVSGLAHMVAKHDSFVQDSLEIFQVGYSVYGSFPGSSYPSMDREGVLTWKNQDTVFINWYGQDCGEFDFTWMTTGPHKLHQPSDGIVLSPPSITREYQTNSEPKYYITYSVCDTTSYPPDYAGIPGLHCVVVQTFTNSLNLVTKRKFVYPPLSQGIYTEEDGQPVVLNIAKPTVGSYRNQPGARVAYQSIFDNDRIDILEVSPDLDTICHEQTDGNNPSLCVAATHGFLKEALTVRGSNWSQTIETCDIHLNKRRDVTFESVQSFGAEDSSAKMPTLFLKIGGASVVSNRERLIAAPQLNSTSRAFSFIPGDDGGISLDYFYSGDCCDIEIVRYRNGDRNTHVTVFRSALTNTNGEWRTQHWNLSNILEPFCEYGIIMRAEGRDLTRSKDMIVPVAPRRSATTEESSADGCGVSITSINPNPAQDMLTVTTATPDGVALTMALSDVFGAFTRIIPTGRLSGGVHVTSIDTSNLASGVYSITLLGGQCAASKLFVIER